MHMFACMFISCFHAVSTYALSCCNKHIYSSYFYSHMYKSCRATNSGCATYGASLWRGLLCSEYPLDSKGKTDNQLKSPFRLPIKDENVKKKCASTRWRDLVCPLHPPRCNHRSDGNFYPPLKSCPIFNSPVLERRSGRCAAWPAGWFQDLFKKKSPVSEQDVILTASVAGFQQAGKQVSGRQGPVSPQSRWPGFTRQSGGGGGGAHTHTSAAGCVRLDLWGWEWSLSLCLWF